ncbi:acetate/propionate family kinase [Oceanidesulfovibrio marinus]|uniref:Acetate kinase n=1 Tax=Oceanidesulfovibrio marinus TaxID=370038 RepID=A0A6P1ZHA9_9BACT|nr:acetate kinase [Oceanidesulfovibrio marinus]QJT09431.1 acetate kinase [Oceanidesulfovibrio marinus]TVM33653.1 acetate kinase [Oceanidesulfovibrio marinus]
MKILVINSGSSSIKFKLYEMSSAEEGEVLASGLAERIGEDTSTLTYKRHEKDGSETKQTWNDPLPNHETGLKRIIKALSDPEKGVISSPDEIAAAGHRVLHAGEAFSAPTKVNDAVIDAIKKCIPLGPLHNPANLDGILVASQIMQGASQVAVFDTAFHQTMPPEAYLYALPYELYKEQGVRRYGFHGTSHKYVARVTAKLAGVPQDQSNIITAHLGNGSSMAAVRNGRCVDTSMGLTPLPGLIMGTRTGDIDPAIIFYLGKQLGLSLEELDNLVNKQSGLKGICGHNDLRDVHTAAEEGEERAKLALSMLAYRNKKFFGAYIAALGRVDAIAFTAGVGENDSWVRAQSLADMEHLGVVIDLERNDGRCSEPTLISADSSTIQVWVVPTDEEYEIARETYEVLS